MPPKKDTASVIFLKLKRQSSAYFVSIPKNETILQLKSVLVDMINQTGGLRLADKPIPVNDVMDIINDQTIDIPNVELNENSDSGIDNDIDIIDDSKSDNESNQTEQNDPNVTRVKIEDVSLGVCENQNDIYTAKLTKLDCDDSVKIESLLLQDFSIIPFKYKNEEFEIYKPLD